MVNILTVASAKVYNKACHKRETTMVDFASADLTLAPFKTLWF